MIEEVKDPCSELHDHIYYLSHHGVVRQDKATTKLRVVYDAYDCLYAGPSFGHSIFDILIHFRFQFVEI